MKTILILGGGIGGIVTARELRRHLGHNHRIVLIDQHAKYTFPPSYLWIAIGWRQPSAIERAMSLLDRYQIEFHHARVTTIVPRERQVITDQMTFEYDYLVIALGAAAASIPTECRHSDVLEFGTPEKAHQMKQRLATIDCGVIAITINGDAQSFPPASYEAAFLLESFFSQRNLKRISVHLFTPEQKPLEFLGSKVSGIISGLLSERKINLHTSHSLTSVDGRNKTLSFENGHTYPYDLNLQIPSYRPSDVVNTLEVEKKDGWIAVNRMMQTSIPNVFAVGDVASMTTEDGTRLPMTGVFTLSQAEIVAFNIAHEIQKNNLRKEFTGSGFIIIELGHGRACNIHGDFLSSQKENLVFNEPNVTFHWGKVVIEKYWLWRWF